MINRRSSFLLRAVVFTPPLVGLSLMVWFRSELLVWVLSVAAIGAAMFVLGPGFHSKNRLGAFAGAAFVVLYVLIGGATPFVVANAIVDTNSIADFAEKYWTGTLMIILWAFVYFGFVPLLIMVLQRGRSRKDRLDNILG